MDAEDDPLLQDAWLNEEEEVAFGPCKRTEGPRLCGKCQWTSRPRPPATAVFPSSFWTVVGWIFTNPYSAGLILFLGCAIPATLAIVMFLHYPALDIDISYNAFEIRNHESSQRFDALASALKSQFGSWGRNRRDLAEFTSETLQRLIFEQLQHLHVNSSRLGAAARQKRSAGRERTPPPPAQPPKSSNQTSRQLRNAPPHWEYPNSAMSANTQTHAHWRIELIFLARGDAENNIFTSERLVTIHEIERKIMDHPHFREFCWKPHEVLKDLPLGSYSYCSPPSSLMTYFFPTERGGKIYYDGLGQDLADIRGKMCGVKARVVVLLPSCCWTMTPITPCCSYSSRGVMGVVFQQQLGSRDCLPPGLKLRTGVHNSDARTTIIRCCRDTKFQHID